MTLFCPLCGSSVPFNNFGQGQCRCGAALVMENDDADFFSLTVSPPEPLPGYVEGMSYEDVEWLCLSEELPAAQFARYSYLWRNSAARFSDVAAEFDDPAFEPSRPEDSYRKWLRRKDLG